MKVGYLQFKPEFGKTDANISKIKKLTSDKNFDLLVLPELANSGYLFSNKKELKELSEKIPDGKFCNALKEICNTNKAYIVSGICEKVKEKFYNSSVLVCPDGKIFVYRKLHLFDNEKKWFTPGNLPLQIYKLNLKNSSQVKVGMMICFDWIFPETARTLALKGAQIICHPSNLVMQYCQKAMSTRALENHVFTVTANRTGSDVKKNEKLIFTGESVIMNTKGNCIAKGSKSKDEIRIIEINPTESLNKNINKKNNLIKDRRINFYS